MTDLLLSRRDLDFMLFEWLDAEALTAAHRTLPFGTNVRIQRLDSGDRLEHGL